MRILAIRGQNLASLAAPFEIDFATGAIGGTGLFAITGETGAGKSTILDALCLALYADYPRASISRRESIPDPSGDVLQASDVRNILRRGASHGHAEADFIGRDGVAYRARWAVRRARGRADGRLQNEERSLERLDGGGNVAAGKTEVESAVAARTGFTFDQFRRTVLLAQGEFDTFLLADEKSRAELLEKITGTEVYTRISQAAFERKVEREQALKSMHDRHSGVTVLREEERNALLAELQMLAREESTATTAHELLSRQLAHARRVAQARAALAAARAELEGANGRLLAAAHDVERLQRLKTVQPLRALADARTEAERLLTDSLARVTAARDALRDSTATVQEAHSRAAACSMEATALSATVAELTPQWEQALLLDGSIESARVELMRAEQEAARSGAEAERAAGALTSTRGTAAILEQQARDIAGRLAANSDHASVAAARGAIAQRFAERQNTGGLLATATKQKQALDRDVAQASARVGDLEQRIASDRQARAGLQDQLKARRDALAAIGEASLAAREHQLRAVESDLSRAMEHLGRRDAALAEARSAREDAEAAGRSLIAAQNGLRAAQSKHQTLSAARAELGRMVDLADATLSEAAERLRGSLLPGSPCPVCGGLDHPHSLDHSAANKLGHAIRERRDQLDRDIEEITRAITAGNGSAAAAESCYRIACGVADAELSKARRATEALAAAWPRLNEDLLAAGLRPIATAPESVASAELESVATGLASEREALAAPRKAAEALRRECEALQQRLDSVQRTLESADEGLEAERGRMSRSVVALAQVEEQCRGLDHRLTAIDADLEPHLARTGMSSADLARDEAAATRHLLAVADSYIQLVGDQAQIEEALRKSNTELQKAETAVETAARELARSEAILSERKETLSSLQARRATLLEGEPTESHKARHLAAESTARQGLATAQVRLTEAERAVAVDRTAAEVADGQRENAENRLQKARATFTEALASIAVDEAGVLALLSVPASEVEALAARIATLRSAVAQAETGFGMRERDLEELGADDPANGADILTLEAELDRRDHERDQIRDSLARKSTLIEQDDLARARAGTIAREIEAAKADLVVWQEVDAAIGQRDGTKFSRFAQGVTLGHLVQLANQQLRGLGPRYGLRRSSTSDLALEIIDHDMGGEIRTPRSLSGGERFLVSLALALALSGLEGRQSFVDTLFIDEGFGSLDRDTLDLAIEALERLQGQGRKVGVVTHVAAMIDRIGVQVRVEKRGGGRSVVRIRDGSFEAAALPAAQ